MITPRKFYVIVVCLLVVAGQVDFGSASFLDWIWPSSNVGPFATDNLLMVPYELSETNDKFIHDTSKILGTKLSGLDFCQRKVILSFQKSCNNLSDEDIAKLSVTLLNCQLLAEGRDIYECAEHMSLKACTAHMPPEVYSSYNAIVARAKTTCLDIRQEQFRGLAEMTVNKLMSSVQQQLQAMSELRGSQDLMQRATLASLDEITDNHLKLLERQNENLDLANVQRLTSEANIRKIMKEKNLLRSGQVNLAKFIDNLRAQIDESTTGVEHQNAATKKVYQELMDDLAQLSEMTVKIFGRLDEVSQAISSKGELAHQQIDQTLDKLNEARTVVDQVASVLRGFQDDYDSKVKWVQELFGKELTVERMSIITIHVCFLLIGMICLVFINADMLSRGIFLGAIAFNLGAVLKGFVEMDLLLLAEAILTMLGVNLLVKIARKYNIMKLFEMKAPEQQSPASARTNGHAIRIKPEEDAGLAETVLRRENSLRQRLTMPLVASTPLSAVAEGSDRSSISSQRDRRSTSRISIPQELRCMGITMRGSRCQLSATYPSTEYCYIHSRTSTDRER